MASKHKQRTKRKQKKNTARGSQGVSVPESLVRANDHSLKAGVQPDRGAASPDATLPCRCNASKAARRSAQSRLVNRLIGVVRDLEDLTDALVSLRDAVRRARLRFPRTFLIVTVKVEVLVILGLISVIT